MKKLSNELRQRQIELGAIEEHVIRSLSDDEIIAAYNKCSCCGEALANEDDLKIIIAESDCTDAFLEGLKIFPKMSRSLMIASRATDIVHQFLAEDRYHEDTPIELLHKALNQIQCEISVNDNTSPSLN